MPPSPDSRDPGAGGATPGACQAYSPTSRLATGVIVSTCAVEDFADGAGAGADLRAVRRDLHGLGDGPGLRA